MVAAAAYLRTSSQSQDRDTQADACERAARARGDELALVFEETRLRDARKRPQLDAALAAAREGGFRRLYVFKLDRLTGLGARDLLNVLHSFDELGVELVPVRDSIPLEKGPIRDMYLAGLAVAAQLELNAIRERIAAARTRLEGKGKKWGRPRADISAATLTKAQELLRRGKTLRQAAVILKVKRPTLARRLRELSQKPPSDAGEKTPAK